MRRFSSDPVAHLFVPALVALASALLIGRSAAQTYQVFQGDGIVFPERFGQAVAITGDLDGDRIPDLAIGAPAGTSGGHVRIVDALTAAPVMSIPGVSGLFGFPLMTIKGFGARLATDALDGCTRMLAGAPGSDSILGSQRRGVGTTMLAWLTAPHTIDSTTPGEEFGAAVANIGDVDGDLFPDFLVGAPGTLLDPLVIGRAVVISGRSGNTLRVHNGVRRANERFGAAVAGLGDVDGDLVPDYAVGDPAAGALGDQSGQVRVFSGASGAAIRTLTGAAGDQFGVAICAVGQSSQGSLVAVGAPLADLSGGRSHAGYVKVFNPSTGALLFTFEGSQSNENLGASLAMGNSSAGTTNGGRDLLVGSPGANTVGANAAGKVQAFALGSGVLLGTVPNPSPGTNDRFGEAIAVASFGESGDRAFAVGAPGFGAGDEGRVYLFTSAGSVITAIAGLASNARTGSSLACIGDVDGDDVADYAIGSFPTTHGHVAVRSGADGSVLPVLFVGNPGFRLGTGVCGAGDPTSNEYRFGLVVGAPGDDRVRTTAMMQATFRRGPSPNSTPTSGAGSGSAVAFLGDVDGDGVTDFAIGAPGELGNGIGGPGRATVFSGRDGATLYSVDGVGGNDLLGAALAGIGDVNGDAIPDLAIGSPFADATHSLVGSGSVRVVDGANGNAIRTIVGGEAGEHFGAALAPLGDVNGDGVADFACGAPEFDGLASTDRGRVRFISGSSGAIFRTLIGVTNGESFGTSLAAMADLDGDARSELLVGAPGADPVVTDQGRVDVYSCGTGVRLDSILGTNISFARLGDAVSAGDLNGDCLPDFVVAAPGHASGRVRVLSRFGIPQSSSSFGQGCPGSGGAFPRASTFGGTPTSQGVPGFGIALSCAASNAPSLLLVGFSDTNWNGLALPFDAGILGFSGCSVRVSGDVLFSAVTNGAGNGLGRAMVPMPIPFDTTLTGVVLFAQWVVVDVGASNGLGAMSQGLRIVITQTP